MKLTKISYFFQEIFLTLFFSWKFPIAPWTVWSLVSFLFLLYFIVFHKISYLYLIIIWVLVSIISVPIIDFYEKRTKSHDNSSIVIDEFVWVVFALSIILYFTTSINFLILGLIFFRIFDIWKPWIIWYADKKISGWLWVILDDIIAWVFAWILSIAIFYIFSLYW